MALVRVLGLDRSRRVVRRVVALALVAASTGAQSAPNEIKVFTDELAGYDEHTLETHVNKATSAGPRVENKLTPLQAMPEYSYGIWRNWEFSLQLPAAFTSDTAKLEGYRAELQYVAPHDEDSGFYWGANVELARVARLGEQSYWNIELIPILGYRVDRWHLVANPGLNRAISGSSKETTFEPAAKVAYRAFQKNYFGVEYYVEAGPLRNTLPREEQSRVLYFAWDGKVGKSDINVGVGRGLTDTSDRWVFKMIYEFVF